MDQLVKPNPMWLDTNIANLWEILKNNIGDLQEGRKVINVEEKWLRS